VQRLPPFAYEGATTIAAAIETLARYGPDAMPVSGGTDLIPNMKQGLFSPKVLVGLRSVAEMRFISYDPGEGLRIGALATLHALATDETVNEQYAALARAAALVSTPQLRRMGTIGGNICLDTRCTYYNQSHDWREAIGYCLKKDGDLCRVAPSSARCLAVNASDLAPVLVAFDATVHLAGAVGHRAVEAAQFYRDDGRFALAVAPGEIVTHVTLPASKRPTRSTYRKLRLRDSFDFPVAGVAAVVRFGDDGRCCDARLVLGAVAAHPVKVAGVGGVLTGTRLEPEALAAAAELAFAAGKPMENTASASLLYRKRMLRVLARRALEDLAV